MATTPSPPIKLKQSQTNSTAQTLLVRETLRISANLASSNSNSTEPGPPPPPPLSFVDSAENRRSSLGLVEEEYVNSSLRLICSEEIDGCRWNYVAEKDALSGTFNKASIRALTLNTRQPPHEVHFYIMPIKYYFTIRCINCKSLNLNSWLMKWLLVSDHLEILREWRICEANVIQWWIC